MLLNNKHLYIPLFMGILLLACTACTKEFKADLPAGKEDAGISFYNAAESFSAYDNGGGIGIFLDTVSSVLPKAFQTDLPYFASFSLDRLFRNIEYPALNNISPYNQVNYIRYAAGVHRLLLNCISDDAKLNQPIIDTSVNLTYRSYSTAYLAERPSVDSIPSQYRLFIVDEPRQVGAFPGRVGVRFIHLSADLGPLLCAQNKADGSTVYSSLLQDLKFGDASPYLSLDTTGSKNKQLQFTLYNKKSGADLLVAGIPATPGRTYAVVIEGFQNTHKKMMLSGLDAKGNIQYKLITVPGNLRVRIRQTY